MLLRCTVGAYSSSIHTSLPGSSSARHCTSDYSSRSWKINNGNIPYEHRWTGNSGQGYQLQRVGELDVWKGINWHSGLAYDDHENSLNRVRMRMQDIGRGLGRKKRLV